MVEFVDGFWVTKKGGMDSNLGIHSSHSFLFANPNLKTVKIDSSANPKPKDSEFDSWHLFLLVFKLNPKTMKSEGGDGV